MGIVDPLDEINRLKARMIQRSFFVMFRRIVAPERLKDAMLPHYRWIIDLEKQGLVFASGPMFAEDGSPGVGMTIFRVADAAQANDLAAADPFCISGAAEFEIKRWQVNEGRLTVSFDFSDQTYEFV